MFNFDIGGRFASVWKKNAAKKIQVMETAREFWGLIGGFVLLRLVTSFVSIFSGFAFFNVTFAGLIDSHTARVFAAVALLSVVEVITAAFLFKFFKFVYAFKWQAAAAMFLGVALFFGVSFYTSTRGIALYKSDTTEQAATIEQANAAAVDSVKAYYAGQVELLRASIDAITPPRWNVDRDGNPQLTTEQQRTKTDLFNKILSLQQEQAAALKEQAANTDSKRGEINAAAAVDADKYAGYVCVIMIMQLIANGVLCFLYSRIYHENNRGDEITAEIKDFAAGIATDTDAIIKTQISEQYGNYLNGMKRNLIALRGGKLPAVDTPPPADAIAATAATPPADADRDQEQEPGTAAADANRHAQKIVIRGFATDTPPADADREQEPTTPPARVTKPVTDNVTDNVTTIGDGWKYCELCGKPYQPRHARQKYCCEPCKFQACANRHGKPYTFNGVVYTPAQ